MHQNPGPLLEGMPSTSMSVDIATPFKYHEMFVAVAVMVVTVDMVLQPRLWQLLTQHPAVKEDSSPRAVPISECLRRCHTLRSWDTMWSAPTRGFSDVREFWKWCGQAADFKTGICVVIELNVCDTLCWFSHEYLHLWLVLLME